MKSHTPAMLDEVLTYLALKPNQVVLDGTVGLAGHATEIMKAILPNGQLIALDQNAASLAAAAAKLLSYDPLVHLRQANFRQLGPIIDELAGGKVDRIFLDLGIASWQVDEPGLGLSFQRDEPLDMRLDERATETAESLIKDRSAHQLAAIFRDFADEPKSRQIADALKRTPPSTTGQLADLVTEVKATGHHGPFSRLGGRKHHPATQVFQALRIAVNDELGALTTALAAAKTRLNPSGRLVILTYHSGEDRIVKQTFRDWATACHCPPAQPICTCGGQAEFHLLTRHGQEPSDTEISRNPRARSARLRAVLKQDE